PACRSICPLSLHDALPICIHVTDVTNASRTMLMDLQTLDWDDELLDVFGIPRQMLPEIHSSSQVYGYTTAGGPFAGQVPLAADRSEEHTSELQSRFDLVCR